MKLRRQWVGCFVLGVLLAACSEDRHPTAVQPPVAPVYPPVYPGQPRPIYPVPVPVPGFPGFGELSCQNRIAAEAEAPMRDSSEFLDGQEGSYRLTFVEQYAQMTLRAGDQPLMSLQSQADFGARAMATINCSDGRNAPQGTLSSTVRVPLVIDRESTRVTSLVQVTQGETGTNPGRVTLRQENADLLWDRFALVESGRLDRFEIGRLADGRIELFMARRVDQGATYLDWVARAIYSPAAPATR